MWSNIGAIKVCVLIYVIASTIPPRHAPRGFMWRIPNNIEESIIPVLRFHFVENLDNNIPLNENSSIIGAMSTICMNINVLVKNGKAVSSFEKKIG